MTNLIRQSTCELFMCACYTINAELCVNRGIVLPVLGNLLYFWNAGVGYAGFGADLCRLRLNRPCRFLNILFSL